MPKTAGGSSGPTIDADRRSVVWDHPLADPILGANAVLASKRAITWPDGEVRLLLLDGEVSFQVGTYGFRADRAVVHIDFEKRPGRGIHHLAVYLDHARPLHAVGAVQAEATRLLVTVSTSGTVELITDLMQQAQEPVADSLVLAAAERVRRHLVTLKRSTVGVSSGLAPEMQRLGVVRRKAIADEMSGRVARHIPPESLGIVPRPAKPVPTKAAEEIGPPAESQRPVPAVVTDRPKRRGIAERLKILPGRGVVLFNAKNVIFEPSHNGAVHSMLILFGDVVLVYQDLEGKRSMSLQAERAVLFVTAGARRKVAQQKFDPKDVWGVYLEDNVIATNGEYTIRAPRVYYDPRRNKAVVLDAVFYTWDVKHKVPIYVRAERLRQEASNSWTAQGALLTTSEFAEPYFAIAAKDLTFEQKDNPDGTITRRFTSRHNTALVGGLPLFYWPYLASEAQDSPLRRLALGYRGEQGAVIRSVWDLFALAGQPKPSGVDLTGQLDLLGDHGPAVGAKLDYDQPERHGFLDAYVVGADNSDEGIADRLDVEHDGETRGLVLWRHREELEKDWDMSLELAYLSDETFLEEFFRSQIERDKPWETSIYFKKQKDEWAFTFLAQHELFDFTGQTTVLQSPGYTVEKQPELGYYVVGASLWEDRLTYYSQTRLSRQRIRVGADSPSDRGFTALQSLLHFGIPIATTNFDDAPSVAGVPSNFHARFDTHHELQAPMKLGPIDAVPHLAGRVTAYDDDFDEFASGSESVRLWGTFGIRLHTHLSKTDDNAENRMLDVHRLRHIVEPKVNVSVAAATLDSEDIPVYDDDVEAIREGATVRIGVRNTWQTQRGGPGRWRTVDWVVVDSDVVWSSDDSDLDRPMARFIGYRPEFSTAGEHFHNQVMWMISDTLAAVAEVNYNIQTGDWSEVRLGGTLQHTPTFSSFVDFTRIDPIDSELLSCGFMWQATRKYRLAFVHRFDFDSGSSRQLEVLVERKLPRWRLMVVAAHDDIDDEQSLGIVLIPDGVRSSRDSKVFGAALPR